MGDDIFKDDPQYLSGNHNRMIRYYYYLERGLEILNNFRNLFLGILGLYIALKLDAWWLMPVFFGVAVLVLTAIGYYNVHKITKIREFLNIRFGTHFGLKTFDYNKAQAELLAEIRDMLRTK